MRIGFHHESAVTLRNRTALKLFITSIFAAEEKTYDELDIIFCSDQYLLQINRSHLSHDYYTDIITFDLSDQGHSIGEIYISIDRVRENAGLYSTSVNAELHRVIFHGVLHLCGYKDKTKPEIKEMRNKEDWYLSQYFHVPRETI